MKRFDLRQIMSCLLYTSNHLFNTLHPSANWPAPHLWKLIGSVGIPALPFASLPGTPVSYTHLLWRIGRKRQTVAVEALWFERRLRNKPSPHRRSNSHTTVSYTHLLQFLWKIILHLNTNLVGTFANDSNSFINVTCAVSYTHLDVYKRQLLGSGRCIFLLHHLDVLHNPFISYKVRCV